MCGVLALPQRGQVLRAGVPSFHEPARRLRVFIFDFFFLGTATARSPTRDQMRTKRLRQAIGLDRRSLACTVAGTIGEAQVVEC